MTVVFHNTGLYNIGGRYPAHNAGVYEVTGDPRDDGMFKAPTLRNVAVRAPYMHDGSVDDLNGVLDHYSAGGRTIVGTPLAGVGRLNPNKDALIHGFELSRQERLDLIAFLESFDRQGLSRQPRALRSLRRVARAGSLDHAGRTLSRSKGTESISSP